MFKRARIIVESLRIAWNFQSYNSERDNVHMREASARFSDSNLRAELDSLNDEIRLKSQELYGGAIIDKKSRVATATLNYQEALKKLTYFSRHYKTELDEYYEKKSAIHSEKNRISKQITEFKDELSHVYNKKKAAFRELERAKSSIDAWYRKSQRGFFGNSGRQLPKHSLFGQSFGDLDAYKYDRDSASDDIQSCKREIAGLKSRRDVCFHQINNLKSEIEQLKTKIELVKADRSHMYELKKQRLSHNKAQMDERLMQSRLVDLESELTELKDRKDRFEAEEKVRLNIPKIKMEIEKLAAAKVTFLASFHLPENIEARKRSHRERWLRERRK